MRVFISLLREPLVHFLLIGGVIFLAYASLNPPAPKNASEKQIEISLRDIDQMTSRFEATWRRPPTRDELDKMIEAQVRESILTQEALLLGMDQDDAIIRQRLAQKMEFLIQSAAGAATVTDADLQDYFEANKAQYAQSPTIAFEQVFLGESPAPDVIEDTLASLTGGADPSTVGQRTMLPVAMQVSVGSAVDSVFGRGFFDALFGNTLGKWEGPVQSGFGLHIVRISSRDPGKIPAFDAIRDKVREDYAAIVSRDLASALFDEMRNSYGVSLPDAAALKDFLQ